MRQLLRYISLAASFVALACLPLVPGVTSTAHAQATNRPPVTQESGDVARFRPRARFPVLLSAQDAPGPLSASHTRGGDCRQSAIEKLRASAPDGFAVKG
jgi:hypothetical protein